MRRSTSPATALICICKLPLPLLSLGKLSSISCTSLGSVLGSGSGSPTTKLTGVSDISFARADLEESIRWTVSSLDPAVPEDARSDARSTLPSKITFRACTFAPEEGGNGFEVITIWIAAISRGRSRRASESLLLTRRRARELAGLLGKRKRRIEEKKGHTPWPLVDRHGACGLTVRIAGKVPYRMSRRRRSIYGPSYVLHLGTSSTPTSSGMYSESEASWHRWRYRGLTGDDYDNSLRLARAALTRREIQAGQVAPCPRHGATCVSHTGRTRLTFARDQGSSSIMRRSCPGANRGRSAIPREE